MMKMWLKASVLTLLTSVTSLWGFEQDLLKSSDIDRIMSQIMSQHVEKREMSNKIIQTALITYINQFDPQHIYFLEEEIKPYLALSDSQLKQIVDQYQKGDFSIFKQLDQTIQKAIERSRKLRLEIDVEEKDKLFQLGRPVESQLKEDQSFARTLPQLKQRLLDYLGLFVEAYKKRYGDVSIAQKKDLVLATYQNRMEGIENQYLYRDEKGNPLPAIERENLFTIHILKALASSLDSHTSFYQANEAYDMRVRLQKEFQGIGIVLRNKDDQVVVVRMIEGGPAAKSGLIEPGDNLLEVDGKSIADSPFEKVMGMLHGLKDARVKLLFNRKKIGEPDKIFSVELKREEVVLNDDRVDVSYETFGNGVIGKITLHSFYQGENLSSEKDVRDAIEKLEKKGNLRGLILDLRDNSGGFLSQAVKVAGLFITNGVIVISKYSNGAERLYRDVDGKVAYDGPLVVLTSKATASAAEIVAQALQDYGVAVIVGDEHTYGKGTIQTQTVTDNQSTSYFKVTVGKYYTVSGKTPQKRGVRADVVVPGHWNKEEIGEIYSSDPVEVDTIPNVYNDDLADVSPDVKSWYLKYYVPYFQHQTNVWRELIPTLRKNSEYRISHNKNYQLFLTGKITEEDSQEEENELLSNSKKPKTYGVDDLQMQEAANVLKDIILLHTLGPKKIEAEEKKSS